MSEKEKQAILEEDLQQQADDSVAAEAAAQTAEDGADLDAAAGEQAESGALAELERQLEEQRKLADEHYQRFMRTQADFDNFRRRSRLEKEELAKYASGKLIAELLPIVDNFDRALAAAKESNDYEALQKGVDMIYRQFDQVLAQEGLERIESVGQPFNPDFHQAVMQVETDEYEEGIVVEELQKGYKLKDKVLRVAMVKVSG